MFCHFNKRRLATSFLCCMFFFISFKIFAAEDNSQILSVSIGEILLLQDKVDRFEEGMHKSGGLNVFRLINKIYKDRISLLPEKDRAIFFWSITINVHLDASFLEDLYILISESCGEELLLVMDDYLEKSKEVGVNGFKQKTVLKNREILKTFMKNKELGSDPH